MGFQQQQLQFQQHQLLSQQQLWTPPAATYRPQYPGLSDTSASAGWAQPSNATFFVRKRNVAPIGPTSTTARPGRESVASMRSSTNLQMPSTHLAQSIVKPKLTMLTINY